MKVVIQCAANRTPLRQETETYPVEMTVTKARIEVVPVPPDWAPQSATA